MSQRTAERPPRRRLRRAERRELILAGAARVFAERGYAGATLAQIAREAGVVKSVVYDHFDSKQELYVDLLQRHADELMAQVFAGAPGESAAAQFRHRTEAFFEFVGGDRFAWRMLFRDPPTGDATIEALHTLIHARGRDAIRELFAAAGSVAVGAEVPRPLANELAAQAVKSINDGLAAWWYDHPEVPRELICAVAVGLAWRGIRDLTNR